MGEGGNLIWVPPVEVEIEALTQVFHPVFWPEADQGIDSYIARLEENDADSGIQRLEKS